MNRVTAAGNDHRPPSLPLGKAQEQILSGERKPAKKRPVGITLLGILILVGGMFCLCAGITETPAGILGRTITGRSAGMIHFLHAGISIYIFYGFIKLSRSAWKIYLLFLAVGVINNLTTVLRSGSFNPLVSVTLMLLFGYYVHGKKGLFVN